MNVGSCKVRPWLAVVMFASLSTCRGGHSITSDPVAGGRPPTVTSLSWHNMQPGLGSSKATSFSSHDPIAYTCLVDAPDTPSVTIYIRLWDEQGTCLTSFNCWIAQSGVLSTASGPNTFFGIQKQAPLHFTPSVVSCWAVDAGGQVSRPLSHTIEVEKGIGP